MGKFVRKMTSFKEPTSIQKKRKTAALETPKSIEISSIWSPSFQSPETLSTPSKVMSILRNQGLSLDTPIAQHSSQKSNLFGDSPVVLAIRDLNSSHSDTSREMNELVELNSVDDDVENMLRVV
jgi:hypothetical protein